MARSVSSVALISIFSVLLAFYFLRDGGSLWARAIGQFVIMVVLGIPFALPVFVLSFFLGFIPYIGGFVSTGLAFLLTVAVGSTADVVIMGVWTIVFNIVTGNVVGPLVYGRTVHLHPAIVLVAIPAGSAIAGILGMFIVIPLIGVVAASWRTALAILASSGKEALTSATAPTGAAPTGASPAARRRDRSGSRHDLSD